MIPEIHFTNMGRTVTDSKRPLPPRGTVLAGLDDDAVGRHGRPDPSLYREVRSSDGFGFTKIHVVIVPIKGQGAGRAVLGRDGGLGSSVGGARHRRIQGVAREVGNRRTVHIVEVEIRQQPSFVCRRREVHASSGVCEVATVVPEFELVHDALKII